MAMELVGGAFLSSFFDMLLNRVASTKIVDFFKSHKLENEPLEKLWILLNSVRGVLDEAEEKQISKPAVKTWFDMLKVAAYEVDDLLDEIAYEALRWKVEAEFETVTDQAQSSSFWGKKFQKKTEEKWEGITDERLKSLVDRLELLLKQIEFLGLTQVNVDRPRSQNVPTTSLVDESSVYGRDKDKEAIITLLQPGDTSKNDLEVIPIVGMGGVGKTTLAQLIYNDKIVQGWFDLQAWVCVSEDYDIFRITKEILKKIASLSCNSMTPDQLHTELKERLKGKKFLLVLDDVWNEKYDDWLGIQIPLKSAAPGSKIIVTTRNESVASIMRTTLSSYQLSELGADDCWLLFAKHAFCDGVVDPNLEGIGKEIVNKCGGLPLAAKALGGLLRCERDGNKWKKIAKSNIWESSHHILPSLRISYQYLPSKLKQLFSYCAIFPKDQPFEREELIRLWMGEGFLTEAGEEKEMEAAGYEYFDQLVSTSFFQLFNGDGGRHFPTSFFHPPAVTPTFFVRQSVRGSSLFIMHDLISDLATSVSEGFSARLEGDMLSMICKSTRHLSCALKPWDVDSNQFNSILEANQLRTLLLESERQQYYTDQAVKVANLLRNLRRLRVLSLQIRYLPNSIGNLKHLRHLKLHHGSQITKLPDTVCVLYNLQTLILSGCMDLAELPMKMGMLINLTYLDIRGTNGLNEMPPHMDRLKKLQLLTDFVIGQRGADSIKELGELQHLKGALRIRNLENVVNTNLQTLKDLLKHKALLEELKLEWQGETQDTLHERRVLEQLRPHVNIKRVSMFNYRGTTFADWVGCSSFSNIVALELHRCKNCISLPPLGQLESLQELSIFCFDTTMKLGPEFMGNGSNSVKKPFQSLKYLKFENMPQWKDWIVDEDDDIVDFPNLQCLWMINCPKIKSLPNLPPSLQLLQIRHCDQLELADVLPNAQKIRSMSIWNSSCQLSSKLLDNGLLYVRIIAWDQSLDSLILSLSTSPTFERLRIDFDSTYFHYFSVFLERLPSGMYSLKASGDAHAHSLFPIIPKRVNAMTFVEEVQIQSCSFKCLLLELFPSLKILEISDCRSLASLSSGAIPLGYFKSLASINIRDCPSLVSFPEGGLPTPNLATFRISNCSNLKSLPAFMDILLPSLVHLHIENCPKLESFPKENLPSKLQALCIHHCCNLMACRVFWGLQECCDSLSEFKFQGYEGSDVHSFPETRLLPPSLKSFIIQDLKNLQFLNYTGLAHLTSLEKFKIIDCPELRCLPEAGLPTSLSSLVIQGCPLLAKSCEPESGEDWLLISHISHVEINSRTIQGSP